MLDIVLSFLVFAATLVIPLLFVPGLLQRRGVAEWRARLIGWLTFAGVMLVAIAFFSGGRAFTWGSLLLWETWVVVGVLLLAVGWDLRRARRSGRGLGTEPE